MKRRYIWIMLLLPALLTACSPKKEAGGGTVEYTCPMHPQVRSDKPGDCPICGMHLEKMEPGSSMADDQMEALGYLAQPANGTVTGNYRVITPRQVRPADTLVLSGYIGFDERELNIVSARVAGRIVKLYVKYTNQSVHKGQPLMTIYSPQLLTAQRNLLQVVRDHDTVLVKGMKEQLRNLGMTPGEIGSVIRTGQFIQSVTIYSPYDGLSRPLDGTASGINTNDASLADGGMNEMNGTEASGGSTPSASRAGIREGTYVAAGQPVFALQNSDRVWAILNIPGEDLAAVGKGDPVQLYTETDPTHMVNGTVDFIPPYRTGQEKTSRVRVYLERPADWKIGTLIRGRMSPDTGQQGLYVPVTAVHYLGLHAVVWVQDTHNQRVYHVREVQAGEPADDKVRITAGIQPGEKIVENAAYMVDSDSFIPYAINTR